MLPRTDLQALAEARVAESVALFEGKHYSGAYYLAGYATELAFKARISRNFVADAIPDKKLVADVYTHNLSSLLALSGLQQDFAAALKLDPTLEANWGVVSKWSEAARYVMWDSLNAAAMIAGTADPAHGVFPWIRHRW